MAGIEMGYKGMGYMRSRQAASSTAGAFEHDRAGRTHLGGAAGGFPEGLSHGFVEGRGYAYLKSTTDKR